MHVFNIVTHINYSKVMNCARALLDKKGRKIKKKKEKKVRMNESPIP